MKYVIIAHILFLFCILIGGCSATRTTPAEQPHQGRISAPAPHFLDHFGAEGLEIEPEPTGDLTIADARRLALRRSPSLEAYGWDIRRSEALMKQASLWSNPEIEFEVMDIDDPEGKSRETEIVIAQQLPIGRDIARRRELAGLGIDLVNWEYEAARLEVLLQVSSAFTQAIAANKRVDLATRKLELIREVYKATEQMVNAGKMSPVELTRLEAPLVEAELALKKQTRLRDSAFRQLSLIWGSREPGFENVAGDLETVYAPPDPDKLVDHINSNPDIARWSVRIAEQAAARRMAVSDAIPDPSLRIGMMDRDYPAEEALIVGLTMPLPLFDRNQGAIQAAREGEKSARARKAAAELQLESLLNKAYTSLANAFDEIILLRERAIPSAEKGFDAVNIGFAEGKLALLDVLDAQRTLFDLEDHYLNALVTYHIEILKIEALTGISLFEMGNTNPQHK